MTDLIGQRLGDFEVLRVLGRGGMGVVYEAVQKSLNRRVALKVIGPGLGLTPRAVDRFKREAEAAARLHHTNIVPVYATGEQGGTHFYAMELIDGPGLDVVIRQLREKQAAPARSVPADLAATGPYVAPDPLPPAPGSAPGTGSAADRFDRVAAIVADAADALHHAHQSGVTHRDVKPSNLLLAADGRVRVTDFGLARMLEQPGVTVTGEFVGTPAYMSPEQITAGRVLVDHRTDVYSLGATLYELLTLRPPFVADGRDRLLAMVIQKDPPTVRGLDPKVPKDLETICLKALDKDPDRRYQSAGAMAEDLRRYLNRFAILAKRAGPLTRAVKWAKRNPAVAGLIAVVLVAAGVVGVFAYEQQKQAERQRAEDARHAEEVRAEKLRGAMDRAMLEAMGGRYDQAGAALAEAEQLGASTGEVRFLRGMIALYRDDAVTAVKELKTAVTLMPDSVAAQAYLSYALNNAGETQEAARLLKDSLAREARTGEDFLFRGAARMFSQPEAGLADIKEAIRRRPSTLALLFRADAECAVAEQTGNLEVARDAVKTAQLIRELLPDPQHVFPSALARLTAYQLLRNAGHQAEAEAVMRDLDADVGTLRAASSPSALWVRGVYYHVKKDWVEFGRLADEIERLPAAAVDSWLAEAFAVARCRQGRAADALAFLDKFADRNSWNIVVHRVLLMLSVDGTDDRAVAELRRFEALSRKQPTDILQPALWCHCGELEEARKVARRMKAEGWTPPPGTRPECTLATLDFYCGEGTEERLFELAKGHRHHTAWTHFALGNIKLSQKQYTAASNHFRTYEQSGVGLLGGIHWAALWADKLEQDPTWPSWIRGKTK